MQYAQKPIGLIGNGLLYQAVRQLAQNYPIIPLTVETLADQELPYALIVSIHDDWSPHSSEILNQYSLKQRVPWLQVYTKFGNGIVGPFVLPGESGCTTCLEAHEQDGQEETNMFAASCKQAYASETQVRLSGLTTFSVAVLAHFVAEEMASFFKATSQVKTRNAVFHVRLDTLCSSLHSFLPVPHCPDCGCLPDDSAIAAHIRLQSQPKPDPFNYRVRSLTAQKASFLKQYVDAQTGIIRVLQKDLDTPYANTYASIALHGLHNGFGHALDYETSQMVAIAEVLERYGARRPGGKRTTVRASYNQLGNQALNPEVLGLHSAEQYAQPDFPFVPYHHDLVCNWVWGYSFQRQQPLLVPERCAYHGKQHWPAEDRPFVYETSNGCALGSCLEEAILYGILEVAERDAFLMTWYARLSLPRIDPFSTSDPMIKLLIERIEYTTGYTLHAFNATLEHGIPCFWIMAVDEQQRSDRPRVLCAAGAHLHPEKALASAIHELTPRMKGSIESYQQGRVQALEMLRNPFAVREMPDHALLYSLPETFERFHFLYHSAQPQTFHTAFHDFYSRSASMDLLNDLHLVIARYLETKLDIIVVDQTTPEQASGQLRCVKVIIPGMLPMTFGHHARRVTNFKRLSYLPYRLGYRSQPLTAAEINPYPHPFP